MKTIHIDGPIGTEAGEVSAKWFRSQLPVDNSPIEIRINSEGGSVFEAFGIYDLVSAYPGRKTAVVASMAFSAASLIPCACDDSAITPNGYTMVHAPHMEGDELTDGDSRLLTSLRKKMISLYSAKTGQTIAAMTKLVEQETFFDAEASIGLGIVSRIVRTSSAVMARMPVRILAKIKAGPTGGTAKARWNSAVLQACGNVTIADRRHPGLRLRMLAEVNAR